MFRVFFRNIIWKIVEYIRKNMKFHLLYVFYISIQLNLRQGGPSIEFVVDMPTILERNYYFAPNRILACRIYVSIDFLMEIFR